jgi:protocatechuate 3,4-dioxygenase beta subunit
VSDTLSRRRLLELGLAVPAAAALLAACGSEDDDEPAPPANTTSMRATPACDDGDEPTPEQTEGPYFTPDSPRRGSLVESGMRGTRLTLTGYVLSTGCRRLRGALLDFWQADAGGEYDNDGYRLRGHQFTDSRGRYRLETIVPGLYTGRTRHIHVKVQPRGGTVLTTQLYFPGEPRNRTDGIFDRELLLGWRRAGDRRVGRYDFVLAE